LAGIITEADFLRLQVARGEAEDLELLEKADEVTSRGVVTIGPEEAASEAAKITVVQDVKRLPDLVRRVLFVDPKAIGLSATGGVVNFSR
jgi:hypothetical protein